MSTLLEVPDASQPLGRRDRAILELFYASGLRLSELVGLDLDDVNLSGRVVRVLGQGPQGADRAVQPPTEAALRAWLADCGRFGRSAGPEALGLRAESPPARQRRPKDCRPASQARRRPSRCS